MSKLSLIAAIIVAIASTTPISVNAFGSFGKSKAATPKLPLPTYDDKTERYIKNPADDGVYPYDAVGSALRHGPNPFITRVTKGDEYEQAILKYMGTWKVDRAEATGNTDARLNNQLDWQYQKMEEKNGKPKVDYTVLKPRDAALTVIWAFGITPLAINVVSSTLNQMGNEPGPCVSKAFNGLGICAPIVDIFM